MKDAVRGVLDVLERYVGPYVPAILGRVFPCEKQEEIDWVALAERLEALATVLEQEAAVLSAQRENQNVIPLRSAVEA